MKSRLPMIAPVGPRFQTVRLRCAMVEVTQEETFSVDPIVSQSLPFIPNIVYPFKRLTVYLSRTQSWVQRLKVLEEQQRVGVLCSRQWGSHDVPSFGFLRIRSSSTERSLVEAQHSLVLRSGMEEENVDPLRLEGLERT